MTFHLKSTSKWWWWCLNEQIAQRLSYSIIVFGLSSKWRWCQNETILYTRRAYGNSAVDSELFYGKRWLSMFPHIQCWLVHTLSVVCATIFWLVVCSIYDKLSDPVGIHRFSAESLRSSPAHSHAFVIFSGILFKACPWCAMSEVFYFFSSDFCFIRNGMSAEALFSFAFAIPLFLTWFVSSGHSTSIASNLLVSLFHSLFTFFEEKNLLRELDGLFMLARSLNHLFVLTWSAFRSFR